jgi:hypothetical protein
MLTITSFLFAILFLTKKLAILLLAKKFSHKNVVIVFIWSRYSVSNLKIAKFSQILCKNISKTPTLTLQKKAYLPCGPLWLSSKIME